MTESQKVVQEWETPSLEDIAVLSKGHVEGLESSSDDAVWVLAGMHHVVLRTLGRKSGKEHKVALPFWRDAEGIPVVVASYAGAPQNPSWYINLADRQANPEVEVRTQSDLYWSVPDILEGERYERAWTGLIADREWYTDYQTKTSRRIPLVALPKSRPA